MDAILKDVDGIGWQRYTPRCCAVRMATQSGRRSTGGEGGGRPGRRHAKGDRGGSQHYSGGGRRAWAHPPFCVSDDSLDIGPGGGAPAARDLGSPRRARPPRIPYQRGGSLADLGSGEENSRRAGPSDAQESAYREWMLWCEDWVRHRLKRTYYEIEDVGWFTRVTAPSTPPLRPSAQLDHMAHEICR